MVLPVPVVDLWRWSVRALPVQPVPDAEPAVRPILSVIPGGAAAVKRPAANNPAAKSAALLARQRLEDQFRQAYRARQAANAAQNISSGINRTGEGIAP